MANKSVSEDVKARINEAYKAGFEDGFHAPVDEYDYDYESVVRKDIVWWLRDVFEIIVDGDKIEYVEIEKWAEGVPWRGSKEELDYLICNDDGDYYRNMVETVSQYGTDRRRFVSSYSPMEERRLCHNWYYITDDSFDPDMIDRNIRAELCCSMASDAIEDFEREMLSDDDYEPSNEDEDEELSESSFLQELEASDMDAELKEQIQNAYDEGYIAGEEEREANFNIDYEKATKADILKFVENNINMDEWRYKRNELEAYLKKSKELNSAVTGRDIGSDYHKGSYYKDEYIAGEALCHNWYLINEVWNKWMDWQDDFLVKGSEYVDMMVRDYVYRTMISDALDEYERKHNCEIGYMTPEEEAEFEAKQREENDRLVAYYKDLI